MEVNMCVDWVPPSVLHGDSTKTVSRIASARQKARRYGKRVSKEYMQTNHIETPMPTPIHVHIFIHRPNIQSRYLTWDLATKVSQMVL